MQVTDGSRIITKNIYGKIIKDFAPVIIHVRDGRKRKHAHAIYNNLEKLYINKDLKS